MGVVRPDARRAQLDLRPRPRRPRPGARHRAPAGGLPRPRSRLRPRASRCRRSSTIATGQVVTNDFAQITLDLSTEWSDAPPRRRARPLPGERCATRSTRSWRGVYTDVNNGVYRCGFAGSPGAPTSRPTQRLFAALDWLAERLRNQRYLVGDTITEADVRLFTTLARFDAVYHGHFKCNRQKLTEMPVLWAYARDLFQTPGLRRHDRLRPDQAALLRRPHRHQPDRHRAGRARTSSGWLTPARPRGSSAAGPFGDGTPPGPPAGRTRPAGAPGAGCLIRCAGLNAGVLI